MHVEAHSIGLFNRHKWKLMIVILALLMIPLTIGKAMAYDEPTYTVLKPTQHDFAGPVPKAIELRHYESMMVAEVNVKAEGWNAAANRAFRPLANYIFGSNDRDEKIGMTIPVTTHSDNQDNWTVAFVMPDRYTENNLPKPNRSGIGIVTRPESLMAVFKFTGRIGGDAGKRNFGDAEQKLRDALKTLGITPTGPAVYAVYNGPFTPFFLRRNEVLIPIGSSDSILDSSETAAASP